MKRTTHWMTLIAMTGTLVLLAGCAKEEDEPTTAKDVKRETKEAIDTTGKYLSEKKDEAVAQAKEGVEKLKAKWASLKEEAGPKVDAMKQEVSEQIDKLDEQVDKLQSATAEKWDDARKATADVMQKTGELIEKAADKVRGDDAAPEDNE